MSNVDELCDYIYGAKDNIASILEPFIGAEILDSPTISIISKNIIDIWDANDTSQLQEFDSGMMEIFKYIEYKECETILCEIIELTHGYIDSSVLSNMSSSSGYMPKICNYMCEFDKIHLFGTLLSAHSRIGDVSKLDKNKNMIVDFLYREYIELDLGTDLFLRVFDIRNMRHLVGSILDILVPRGSSEPVLLIHRLCNSNDNLAQMLVITLNNYYRESGVTFMINAMIRDKRIEKIFREYKFGGFL